jgi:Protein of unknown function (DUF3305)
MVDKPTWKLSVILAREAVESRWESHRWQLLGVVPDRGGVACTLVETDAILQRLFPGFEVTLFRDEAEGYYLNASSGEPSVFVSIRHDEAGAEPYPFQATLSYNEAARWMDGGEKVDRAVAWPELAAWMGAWVEENYRPEPRKRRKPSSFVGKEGQFREKTGR